MNEKELAAMMRALGDENRIRIVTMLIPGERCANELLEELAFSQPTLSHHIRLLCDAGVLESRKAGKWIYYRIDEAHLSALAEVLASWKTAGERVMPKVKPRVERPVLQEERKEVTEPEPEKDVRESMPSWLF